MRDPRNSALIRTSIAAALVSLAIAALAIAKAGEFVVEDWSTTSLGARGIPANWKGQNWGSPAYDFSVVADHGMRALHMRSKNEGSTVSKQIEGSVNLQEAPILEWNWKIIALPTNGNSCVKHRDDQAAQVFVVWPRFPEALRSRILGYVWDTTQPVGQVCKSTKTRTVTYIVVRSGTADLGKWFTERRNVREDFRRVYGEESDPPGSVAISIDSDDTRSYAEAMIGAIVFRRQ